MASEGKQPTLKRISRREFARDAALVAATISIVPTELLAQTAKTANPAKPPIPPEEEGLSVAAKAEAEMSYTALLSKYGDRLDSDQRKDAHRLLMQQQKSIEAVRSYRLENHDEPAAVLHLELPEAR